MELPVMLNEKNIGTCILEDVGLYWRIQCKCELVSDKVERIYVGEKKMGVLEKVGDYLTMKRMVSKASYPELPPEIGYLTLYPQKKELPMNAVQEVDVGEQDLWEGEILGYQLKGRKEGEYILFPYDEALPCPCEPLMCFFEIRDGYWTIPIEPRTNDEK